MIINELLEIKDFDQKDLLFSIMELLLLVSKHGVQDSKENIYFKFFNESKLIEKLFKIFDKCPSNSSTHDLLVFESDLKTICCICLLNLFKGICISKIETGQILPLTPSQLFEIMEYGMVIKEEKKKIWDEGCKIDFDTVNDDKNIENCSKVIKASVTIKEIELINYHLKQHKKRMSAIREKMCINSTTSSSLSVSSTDQQDFCIECEPKSLLGSYIILTFIIY
jgi:hypothetical protein